MRTDSVFSTQVQEIENYFLTVPEERILALSYEYQLREFCRKFQPPMPRYVVGTALHYLKRFYMQNSVMDYHPKEILYAYLPIPFHYPVQHIISS